MDTTDTVSSFTSTIAEVKQRKANNLDRGILAM